jgi:membrane-anchored protein YejM (alkaline phosphatase superfamily)
MLEKDNFKSELFVSFLLNLIIVFFIAVAYLKFIESPSYLFAKTYIFFSTLSHFAFLYSPILFISIIVYELGNNQKLTKIIFFSLSTFAIIILKIDSVVYAQFRYHLSPFVFRLVFGTKATDIFQFSAATIITAVLTIVVLIFIQIIIYWIVSKIVMTGIKIRVKAITLFFIVSIIFTHITYAWASASYYRPITQIAQVFPFYHPLTANRFLRKHRFINQEKLRENRDLYAINHSNSINYPLSPIISENPINQKNILIIAIDSWRFDCMDSVVTPNIYRLSKKSQSYLNHYSGSNGTIAGVFSIFYGISGLYWDQFTRLEKSPVLIEQLKQDGYKLNIFSSSNLQNPPFDKNIFSAVPNLRLSSKAKVASDRDKEITNEWLNASKKSEKKPFFGFLFYDAPHAFDYPKDYDLPFNPSLEKVNFMLLKDGYNPEKFFNRYKNAVHFVDGQIGLVLKQLEDEKLMDSTIVIITADHGQEFNDNKKGYWQHGGNYSKYQIKVPMILYDASKLPKEYNTLSLHYDIVPTLMNSYLGVTSPYKDYSMGLNLFNLKPRDWFLSGYTNNYAIVEKDRITKIYATGLYDITDLNLNIIENAELHYDLLYNAMVESNVFYAKEKSGNN